MNLNDHPSVIAFRQRQQNNQLEVMTLQRLKAIVLESGADDVGVVEIDRPSLQDQKEAISMLSHEQKPLSVLFVG